MRLVVVGDFHGKLHSKIIRIIKRNKVDLILSIGDYLPFSYRKLWFKYCYVSRKPLWTFIGKSEYKKLILRDLDGGEKILKKLNSLGVLVFTVLGNMDYPDADDIMDEKRPKGKEYWKW